MVPSLTDSIIWYGVVRPYIRPSVNFFLSRTYLRYLWIMQYHQTLHIRTTWYDTV